MVAADPPAVQHRGADAPDLLQEALILSAWGWSVFPTTDRKTPRVRWSWFQHRRPRDREVERMFALEGAAGIAVVTGRISGDGGHSLVVRDFDQMAAYDLWRRRHPHLAGDAPTVRTRRGRHVYVMCPGYASWQKLSGGELIADHKHYVILPPSRHPSGALYCWEGGPPLGPSDFPRVALADTGFLPLLPAPPESERSPEEAEEDKNGLCLTTVPDLPRAIREAALRTLPSGPGQRNASLLRFARSLRDLIPDDAPPGLLHHAVVTWWTMARLCVRTQEFDETIRDFRHAWARVRVPMSRSLPLATMAAAAAVAEAKDANRQGMLMAAIQAQSAQSPDGTVYLACRVAARLTGMSPATAARNLAELVRAGKLDLVHAGTRSRTRRMATVYRPALPEHAAEPSDE